jgi:hypothetical protein
MIKLTIIITIIAIAGILYGDGTTIKKIVQTIIIGNEIYKVISFCDDLNILIIKVKIKAKITGIIANDKYAKYRLGNTSCKTTVKTLITIVKGKLAIIEAKIAPLHPRI